ncbi:hypothetical protein Poly30_44160 [Planctomycetes bacterium Poly30]|uniref:Uncharacterized protein n=1 Tax=Saltatorellus ferox TaxID=2528018 RepID=A0A518EXR0_9BACT|nr:hypothetical protein Poly30_44160 [Planctomycetes bacterium Poly30]
MNVAVPNPTQSRHVFQLRKCGGMGLGPELAPTYHGLE